MELCEHISWKARPYAFYRIAQLHLIKGSPIMFSINRYFHRYAIEKTFIKPISSSFYSEMKYWRIM